MKKTNNDCKLSLDRKNIDDTFEVLRQIFDSIVVMHKTKELAKNEKQKKSLEVAIEFEKDAFKNLCYIILDSANPEFDDEEEEE